MDYNSIKRHISNSYLEYILLVYNNKPIEFIIKKHCEYKRNNQWH